MSKISSTVSWSLLVLFYLAFTAVLFADFWSPIRYGKGFAATGWTPLISAANYVLALTVMVFRAVGHNMSVARILAVFGCVGVLFGTTAWYLEAYLYISYAKMGLGGLYLLAALAGAAVAAVLSVILRAFFGKTDH